MPRYINNSNIPIYYNETVFRPYYEVEILDTLKTQASVLGNVAENYTITLGVDDTLLIRFNDEVAWTTVVLTAGAGRTATNIVTDINTAYGSTVAFTENGYVRITAPRRNNTFSAIYIENTGSTAATLLGLATDDVLPVDQCSSQVFTLSSNSETYNIDATNNTFIFKFNDNINWITATLTIGATQTAENVAYDINQAYQIATNETTKVAFAVTPVTGGNTYIKLIAPNYNNAFGTKLYIKSTNNTALTVLGFTGDNYEPLFVSNYPSLVQISPLPLYNPILKEETITFAAAETKIFYLTDSILNRTLSLFRATTATFTIFIESASNTPSFTVAPGESFSLMIINKITKLIITSSAAGSIFVREFFE
ncbi:MAG: hypothetical protein PHD05_00585 [Sphaerochaetaceae bacterium]|nr:hypothetical protein [Sphaerochaetaceae bacterium]